MPDDRRLRALLRRFLEASDSRAMDEFVAATRPRLRKAARRIGNPQDAEDSVQAAYHALLQRGREVPTAPLFPWLLVATIRIAYRRKAVEQRSRNLENRLAIPAPDRGPVETAARLEEVGLVRDAITRLPAHYRDVVVLHYLQGLTVAEAAALLEVPRSTVTTRLRRARRLLRARLPRLTYGMLILPWLAADGWASIAPAPALGTAATGGIVMSSKSTAVVLLGLVATGGVGIAIGRAGAPERADTAVRSERYDVRTAELVREIEELRQSNRTLREQLEAPRPPTRGTAPAKAPPVPREQPERKIPPIPRVLRDAARELGVSDRVLALAWQVEHAEATEVDERFDELRRCGREGFLAFTTLLRTGWSGRRMEGYFEKLWRAEFAGAEEALIAFIGEEKQYGYGKWTAYRVLGYTDTVRARDFLVESAAHETNAGHYLSLARALGQLREPRAFDDLARRIGNKEWHVNVRAPIMGALVEIDPNRAREALLRHVRDPDSDVLGSALHYLGTIDPDLPSREAAAILDGPRARTLDGETLRALRRLRGPEEK